MTPIFKTSIWMATPFLLSGKNPLSLPHVTKSFADHSSKVNFLNSGWTMVIGQKILEVLIIGGMQFFAAQLRYVT